MPLNLVRILCPTVKLGLGVAEFLAWAGKVPWKFFNLNMAILQATARREQPSGGDGWLRDLREARDEAKALKADIPGPELAAHERAAGASPGAVDRRAEDIAKKIAEEVERGLAAEAKALGQEIPQRDLSAHAGAAGAGPDTGDPRKERDAGARRERGTHNEEDERRERDAGARRERGTLPVHDASQGLLSDWDAHVDTARQEGIHPFHASGYGELVERIRSHAREAGANMPAPLAQVLKDHDPLVRAEREANKLADRLGACMERRDRLLQRAERKLPYNRPFVDLGGAYTRWQRGSDGAIEAGRELLGNERYEPHLDALGGRAKIEAGVARLEKGAVLDHLPPRIVSRWEKVDERVRKTGRHRFFLPEHERVCELMSRAYSMDPGAQQLLYDEPAMRMEMNRQAEWLGTLESRLQECVRERELAQKQERPFVRQENYAFQRYWAETAVEGANTVLAQGRKYAPHFNENPNLRETLKTLSGALDRSLRSESPEWERIQSERQRIEMERQQSRDRSQGRGISW